MSFVPSVAPSKSHADIRVLLQPLFDCVGGQELNVDLSIAEVAIVAIANKIQDLNETETIFESVPRCCLQVESLHRILSKDWLKDDLLTVFTNLLNFAFHDSENKFVCFNTTQTEVFLRQPFNTIVNNPEIIQSMSSGDFSETHLHMSSVLKDWYDDCRVDLLTSSLQREFRDIPSLFLFLDHVDTNHYVLHVVHIIKNENDWFAGVVTTYDHLFRKRNPNTNVSIRRCLVAK